MNKGYHAALIYLVASISLIAQPAATPKDEAFSENRKFSVEISETEINKPILAVFARDGEAPRLVWSRSLVPQGDLEYESQHNFGVGQLTKTVSNDGKIVILRPRYAHDTQTAIRALTQKGDDAQFAADDLTSILEEAIDDDYPQPFSGEGSMLELFLESEKPQVLALWFSAAGRWLTIDLEKMQATMAAGKTAQMLDTLGLAKAREIVRESQGSGLSRMLDSLRKKASEIVPGMMDGTAQPSADPGYIHVAYRFLAAQKKPEDRALIEKLLEGKLSPIMTSSGFGDRRFGIYSSDRALGEELLAKWDGQELQDIEAQPGGFHFGSKQLRRFGALDGIIHLPFKMPDQPGPLWLILIPANVSKGAWARDASVIKASIDFNMFGPPGSPVIRQDKIPFLLDTLTPGEYRLKAFWDRRAPGRPGNPNPNLLPEPGDYESAESETFRVEAGKRIRDVALICTQRIGPSDQAYKADVEWAQLHPASTESEPQTINPWQSHRSKRLVNAPVADWILRTNENTGDLHVSRLRLVESSDIRTGERRRSFTVRFRGPAPKNKNEWMHYEAWLEDEHGCRFRSDAAGISRRSHELHFSIVPYGAKQMKLVIALRNNEPEVHLNTASQRKIPGASFLLTNLFAVQPQEWTAESIPARRELDLVTVELSSLNPAAQEYTQEFLDRYPGGYPPVFGRPGRQSRPENQFTFLRRDGSPAAGWQKISGAYSDRWGNESTTLSEFCSEEELFKLSAHFAREPDKAHYRPEEIWEVPISRIPGPGETLPLNLTNQLEGLSIKLYSVGGTGEFTYEEGRLVSATNRLADGGFNAHFRPGSQRMPQPKLFLVNNGPPGLAMYYNQRRDLRPITLGARMPHLACRIPETTNPLYALLEQDTSIPEPMNAPPEQPYGGHWGGPRSVSTLRFLPLDFRPGETDKTLTFLVQKPRSAEFVVRVKKGDRSPAGE